MTTYIKIAILAACTIGALLLGLFLGWHFKGETDLAKQGKEQIKAQAQYDQQRHTEIAAMLKSSGDAVKLANKRNDDTAAALAATQVQLEDQQNALDHVKSLVDKVPVGTCAFTPASDGVWNSAYRSVFPPATTATTNKNHKASG